MGCVACRHKYHGYPITGTYTRGPLEIDGKYMNGDGELTDNPVVVYYICGQWACSLCETIVSDAYKVGYNLTKLYNSPWHQVHTDEFVMYV
jgi:hypothetical protein